MQTAAPVRPLVTLLVVCIALFARCDSGSTGPRPSDLEGAYAFDRFEFTVRGVDDFDLLADTLTTTPRLEFFGGNARVTLVYRLEGQSASSQISGSFATQSNSVTVDFSSITDDDRRELLLPPTVRFELLDNRERLRADQRVENVDLHDYSPGRYGGLTQNVNGTLVLRLTRIEGSNESGS